MTTLTIIITQGHQGKQQLVCKPDHHAETKHKAVASRSGFSFLQFCRKYKQPEPQNGHMTITITQGHLHTRQLCRRKNKAVATHKAEAGSHSSNSAENTNTNTKASDIHYKKWSCKICLMLIVIFLLLYE